jgi:hypothetical protein
MKARSAIVAAVAVVVSARLIVRAESSLTIYNQNFGVVRQELHLSLKKGVNTASCNEITSHLEPDSVILRDARDGRALDILEQTYRSDPVTEPLLLSLNEGKTIDFLVARGDKEQVVQGKIVRSGYVPHYEAMQRYGYQYYQSQMASMQGGAEQPIIEVDGKLQFSLPGKPLFPSLADDAILKPTLNWRILSEKSAEVDAELGYITGGMSWSADYNAVSPENGDALDITGWITMDNQSGKTFENAAIDLMAGDVSRVDIGQAFGGAMAYASNLLSDAREKMPALPTEKPFDEFHLYTLPRPVTLRDRETVQVEFIRAAGIKSKRVYIYDGAKINWAQYSNWNYESFRNQRDFGVESETKVAALREFVNSESNGLGLPLPKGRLRFYKRDGSGHLQFVGENLIDHTPKDETIHAFTGYAFDLSGERRRVTYDIQMGRSTLDESFEIKLRNHKKESVEIRVKERLYRGDNWKIVDNSDDYRKLDSHTIEFPVQVPPNGEKVVTYGVHYTW